MLHALSINRINNTAECIKALDRFLPFVDNWAVCDSIAPVCFKRNDISVLDAVLRWVNSDHPYTVRFGISVLMKYYLDDNFDASYLEIVNAIQSDHYYVNMMIAWYFATALAKQYPSAITYLVNNRLSRWVHNKTIQKAIESYRLINDQKSYLRKLKQ